MTTKLKSNYDRIQKFTWMETRYDKRRKTKNTVDITEEEIELKITCKLRLRIQRDYE